MLFQQHGVCEMEECDAEPTLQVSPGALLSDQPRSKESKRDKRKGGGLSLGRTKPRDSAAEKVYKKGKHTRNKSGSRTPPDSPRGDRTARGGKSQPSPNVKGHRKRYSQLGFDLSSAESEGPDEEEEEEEGQTYFTNQVRIYLSFYHCKSQVLCGVQAVSDISDSTKPQEPFFTIGKTPDLLPVLIYTKIMNIERETKPSNPASPG